MDVASFVCDPEAFVLKICRQVRGSTTTEACTDDDVFRLLLFLTLFSNSSLGD